MHREYQELSGYELIGDNDNIYAGFQKFKDLQFICSYEACRAASMLLHALSMEQSLCGRKFPLDENACDVTVNEHHAKVKDRAVATFFKLAPI